MTGRTDASAEQPATSRAAHALFAAAFGLALVATTVLVLSDSLRWMRLGVVAALWAALAGAFLAARYRRQVADRAEAAAAMQHVYELELEREIAARREHELEVEADARRKADEQARDDLAELRAELKALRDHLEALLGGEVLVERYALHAQATRMRALAEDARSLGHGSDEIRRITAGTVVPGDAETELIEAIRTETKVSRSVRTRDPKLPDPPSGRPLDPSWNPSWEAEAEGTVKRSASAAATAGRRAAEEGRRPSGEAARPRQGGQQNRPAPRRTGEPAPPARPAAPEGDRQGGPREHPGTATRMVPVEHPGAAARPAQAGRPPADPGDRVARPAPAQSEADRQGGPREHPAAATRSVPVEPGAPAGQGDRAAPGGRPAQPADRRPAKGPDRRGGGPAEPPTQVGVPPVAGPRRPAEPPTEHGVAPVEPPTQHGVAPVRRDQAEAAPGARPRRPAEAEAPARAAAPRVAPQPPEGRSRAPEAGPERRDRPGVREAAPGAPAEPPRGPRASAAAAASAGRRAAVDSGIFAPVAPAGRQAPDARGGRQADPGGRPAAASGGRAEPDPARRPAPEARGKRAADSAVFPPVAEPGQAPGPRGRHAPESGVFAPVAPPRPDRGRHAPDSAVFPPVAEGPPAPAPDHRGKRAAPDSGVFPPVADPAGPRAAPEPAGRRAAPEPEDAGGRRRRPEGAPSWQEALAEEPAGSHAAGKSVSELLAAHGGNSGPRKRRRRDDD